MSNEQAAANKTVADIWEAVQKEQRNFNRIIQILVGLLIVAAAVAVAAAALSFFEFRNLQRSYENAIAEAQASARVSAGEATRERQRMRDELIQLREAEQAEREQADLIREVDRVLANNAGASELMDFPVLIERAVSEARRHVLGVRLNMATVHLVDSVLSAVPERLSVDETLLLQAARADWRSSGKAEAEIQALIDDATTTEYRGLGHAALAQHHRLLANADNLGDDDHCILAIEHVEEAERTGVRAIGPYLWMGECLRKRGRQAESFEAFVKALTLGDKFAATDDNRRVAAHGAGTTLIARAAAGQLEGPAAAEAVKQVRPLLSRTDVQPFLNGTGDDPLDAAEALLRYAGSIRVDRGEGEVGEYYTTENIGFIHVLRQDWEAGLRHARQIDEVIPLAWNLSVLHISAAKLAEAGGTELSSPEALQAEAAAAARTLALMKYEQFDESELRKLLPPEYSPVVNELIAPAAARESLRDPSLQATAVKATVDDAAAR